MYNKLLRKQMFFRIVLLLQPERKKFEFGRFYEVPFLVVKQEEEKETEEISLSLFSVTEPIEVKAWQYYLGTIALDNGTSTYIVIAG